MVRKVRVLIVALLATAALLACSRAEEKAPRPEVTAPTRGYTTAPTATPTRGYTTTPTKAPTRGSSPTPSKGYTATPLPTPTEIGRLPTVVAQVSLALPGGDAYEPLALTFDEQGRAVVLCYYGSAAAAATSVLVTLDPSRASRSRPWPLPGRTVGPLTAAHGQAYIGYEDAEHRQHLVAVDLSTGETLADVTIDFLYSGDVLQCDSAGRIYIPLADRLEVRDGASLQLLRSLAYGGRPRERVLALDAKRGSLYLITDDRLRAYRLSDLRPLWDVPGPGGSLQHLVLDRAGRRLYAYAEIAPGGAPAGRLLVFDAESGKPLDTPQTAGQGWQLVAADSAAGHLFFAQSEGQTTRLWQTQLDGTATGVAATTSGYARFYAAPSGPLLGLSSGSHLARIFEPAGLRLTGEVALGIEIRSLLADPGRGRVYINDSAGRLHVLDSLANRRETTLPAAGSGQMVLDAANHQLFVSREPGGREVTVIDTVPLTVTGVITGGDHVAIDSAGRRAFVGWTASGPTPPGEVLVWDTRSLRRLGAIAQRGEPTYNPLRGEVYLRDYTVHIVDGRTLAVSGELTPDIGQQPLPYCNGCLMATSVVVDPAQDVIVVGITALSAGKGPGSQPQPRLFSARSARPVTNTVTLMTPCGGEPLVIPAEQGRTYVGQHYARYVTYEGAVAQRAGAAGVIDYRDGLSFDLYLPGRQVGLSLQNPYILAFDPIDWQPLGWLPYQCIRAVDLLGRRLYAWERSLLTVLSFDGGRAPQPPPAEQLPVGKLLGPIQEIQLSPAFERDRTVFAVAGGQLLRSTNGGARWSLLHGGLPAGPAWARPVLHLTLSPTYDDDHTLYLGGYLGDALGLGVWRSTDAGDRWLPLWQGLQHLKVDRIVASPRFAEDRTLLAYCHYDLFWQGDAGSSLYRSRDGGNSWTQVALRSHNGNPPPLPKPEELLPYLPTDVQFRVNEQGNGIERSGDRGRTWQTVLRRSEPGKRLLAAVPSPWFENDGQVFALSPDLLYHSTDGGRTWEAASDRHLLRPDYPTQFTALAIGRLDSTRLVVFVGDQSGAILPLDPQQVRWGATPTPAPTAGPTRAATATPCAPPAARFAEAYARWGARLGCPSGAGGELTMAAQRFERGRLFWRSDTQEVYVLRDEAAGRTWSAYLDTWQEGQPDRDPALQAPAGREQPVRGFGRVWREQLGGANAAIGWAVEGEAGYSGAWQPFAHGLLLSAPDGRVYALFADGRWE